MPTGLMHRRQRLRKTFYHSVSLSLRAPSAPIHLGAGDLPMVCPPYHRSPLAFNVKPSALARSSRALQRVHTGSTMRSQEPINPLYRQRPFPPLLFCCRTNTPHPGYGEPSRRAPRPTQQPWLSPRGRPWPWRLRIGGNALPSRKPGSRRPEPVQEDVRREG